VIPGVELICDGPASARGKRFFTALRNTAPNWVRASAVYTGRREVIAVYGAGNPARAGYVAQHRAAGGRVVYWDLAYWDRVDSLRMSVDEPHPTAVHLALVGDAPARRKFVLREDAQPAGHVLLAGLGRKSVEALGLQPLQWERTALQLARERWPGARIVWRPKGTPVPLDGLPMLSGTSIEQALIGARALVCRHSNVAVDACAAGVPVWCDGGAAAVLYDRNPEPTRAQRADFLRKLSWFEWHKQDAPQAWSWMHYLLESRP
jgi:hypothetical protein